MKTASPFWSRPAAVALCLDVVPVSDGCDLVVLADLLVDCKTEA